MKKNGIWKYGLAIVLLTLLMYFGCPFYAMFEIPCPCCGVTRAWLAFFRGEPVMAFRYHALFLIIPLMLLLFVIRDKVRLRWKRICDAALYIFAAAVFAYSILRWTGAVIMP